MKINRILVKLVFCLCAFPALASAQSFWLHKPVYGNNGFRRVFKVATVDTDDCIFVPGTPGAALTQNYYDSWNYIFQNIANDYTVSCIAHPSHNLILLGCNAEKTITIQTNNGFDILDFEAGHIVRSTDAGMTWTDTAIGFLDTTKPQNSIGAMAALDSNHIFIPIDAKSYNPSDSDHFLHSSDGGVTWQSIPCPVSVHYPGSANPSLARITPVAAYPAPNTLIIAEWDSSFKDKIFRSTDLGKSWTTGFQTMDNITKFAFVSPLVGFASGYIYTDPTFTATIDKTTDGGLTWSNIFSQQIVTSSALFNSTAGLYSIAFADSLHGLACGDQGLILRTTDGGNTWNQMTSDYTNDDQGVDLFGDVGYPDTNHAIIASSSGEALVYQPNGILSLPNITYPLFSPPTAPQTFDVTWSSVPGATHYSITITTSNYPISTDTTIIRDTNVTATFYQLSNLVDTSSTQSARQYEIYLQAFSTTNQSNIAERAFIVYAPTNGVTMATEDSVFSIAIYPNPTSNLLHIESISNDIVITDLLGRIRMRAVASDGTIDVSSLPQGVYSISDGKSQTQFVKE